MVKNTSDPNYAIELVKKIDEMIKCSKNNILMFAYKQRRFFQKFKTNEGFSNAVIEFGISKTTINFKINIVKFINQHPGIRKSSISLFYLKNNFRIIKEVCQEYFLLFWCYLILSLCSFYKKGSWFLLAKIDRSLLRMSIFYGCFLHILQVMSTFWFFMIGILV